MLATECSGYEMALEWNKRKGNKAMPQVARFIVFQKGGQGVSLILRVRGILSAGPLLPNEETWTNMGRC